jgi:TadE-like protein
MRPPSFRRSPDRQRSRGQSLVEFAIVFPVMMLILVGIIQFGLIFWAQNTLTQVVRDTGRWAATQQTQCDLGGPALVTKADQIARVSSLLGYTAGLWNGAPAVFDVSPAPREGIEASWPISTDPTVPPGGVQYDTDCPPKTNQIAWFVNIRAHHEVPLFFPVIGQFIPSCNASSCSLSSSVQFRMEPSR